MKIGLFLSRHLLSVIVVVGVAIALLSYIYIPPSRYTFDAAKNTRTGKDLDEFVFVFSQASDVHVRGEANASQNIALEKYIKRAVDVFRPQVVLFTGDIVSGYGKDGFLFQEAQWRQYKDILDANLPQNVGWIDIMGNHDGYGLNNRSLVVPYIRSGESFFEPVRKVVLKDSRHTQSADHTFFAIRCVPEYLDWHILFGGLKMPDMKLLKQYLEEETALDKPTYLLSHMPYGWLSAPRGRLSFSHALNLNDKRRISFSLTGHFHFTMYKRHHHDVVDMVIKSTERGAYRLLAIDNGFFAFDECEVDKWPIGVVTYPKDARFLGRNEPIHLFRDADQIRVVAFSVHGIKNIKASVNGKQVCSEMEVISDEDGFYCCDWDSSAFTSGLHQMTVFITDNEGNEKVIEQPFSLDGTLGTIKETLTSYIYSIGFPVLVYGFRIFMIIVISVLIILPKSYMAIMRVVTNKVLKVPRVFSPETIGWVSAVCSGQTTMREMFKTLKFGPVNRILTVLLWEIFEMILMFSEMKLWHFCMFVGIYVYAMFLPVAIVASDFGIFPAFSFAFIRDNEIFLTCEYVFCVFICFLAIVFYPAYSITARSDTLGTQPHYMKMGWYPYFLFAAEIFGTLVNYLVFKKYLFGHNYLISPILYICDFLVVWSFYILFIRNRKIYRRVSQNSDSSGEVEMTDLKEDGYVSPTIEE